MTYSVSSHSTDLSSILLPNDDKNQEFMMSLVVISTADIAKSLKTALLEYHRAREEKYKLYVHVSEKMKAVMCSRKMHVDYFIMLADPRYANAAEKVKQDLERLRPAFVATSRCVVAVAWPEGILPCLVARCSTDVHEVCRSKLLHKLVQREEGPAGEKHLVDRLLRLARTARGLNASGVPNLSGCFSPGPHWDSLTGATAMEQADPEDDDDDDDDDDSDDDE